MSKYWVFRVGAEVAPSDAVDTALFHKDDALTDAVVIRKGDLFASATLYEYANTVRTAVEVADDLLSQDPAERPHTAQRLMELADWMYEQAADAEDNYKGKVPD